MTKNKSKSDLEVELRILKQSRIAENVTQVFLHLIRWGGIVLVVRYMYLAIDSLSGKDTNTDILINFLSNITISNWLAWLVGILGVLYGLRQKKLRKDTTERLQDRNISFEVQVDPERTTSTLTARGDTRPEDL